MLRKANLMFSNVSVWVRNFWKTLENTSVDGKHFEMKMFLNVSGLIARISMTSTDKFLGH